MSAARSRAAATPDNEWNALIAEWLSGLFMAPLSADAVASYRDGLGATFLDIFAEELGCAAGARRMRSALTTEATSADVARKLAHAFTLLFEGAGGHHTVPLYESAYAGGSGRLFQSPVGKMEQLLRDSGLSAVATSREPSDHLPVELALLAQMMRRGVGHLAQRVLLDDHLLAWVPLFAGRCDAADRSGFYAGAAQVMTGFLTARRAALEEMGLPKMPQTGAIRWRSE
jgi:TorA specific chaperone